MGVQKLRLTEYLGSEGTFRHHPVQPPCSEQGHLQPDQVARSPIQPGLGCFQEWDIYHLSGQPVPVLHHPYCEDFFLKMQVQGAAEAASDSPVSTCLLPCLLLQVVLEGR